MFRNSSSLNVDSLCFWGRESSQFTFKCDFLYRECCYTMNLPCSVQVLSDVSHALRCPLPIFCNPLRLALCVSMCLDKTASSCTNWNQWHKLQGRVNKLYLHGNTCWQMCPLTSPQRYIGIAACTRVKPFAISKRRRNEPQIERGRFVYLSVVLPFWKLKHNRDQMRGVW